MSATTDLKSRARALLEHPKAAHWIVLLGAALTATSLWGGLAADDYLHALALRDIPFVTPHTNRFDLFRFANGDPQIARAMIDAGEIAWTSDLTARFAFFRPLTTLTHLLDYWAWPQVPALMHAQSVAWFAAGLAAAGAIYRRLLGRSWVAGLALLLYALDDTHGPAVGWLANRNSLIALTFSLLCIWAHDRWRREGRTLLAIAPPFLLGLALLAGESAVATFGYLAGYAIHLDRGTLRSRLLSLAPCMAVAAAWRLAYAHMGFGVFGSGVYFDPGHDPIGYLAALPRRLPFLLLAQFGPPRSDLAEAYGYMSGTVMGVMLTFTLLALVLFAFAFAPLLRREPVARFFATGMLLAALPVCSAFPSDRLLLFVGIGAMGLIAQFVAGATDRPARALSALLLAIHLVLAPPLLAMRSRFIDYQLPTDFVLPSIPHSADVASKSVILVNPPHDLFHVYISAVRALRGEPVPAHLWCLADVTTSLDATRLDDRTLKIHPAQGYLEHEGQRMFRDPRRPLLPGSKLELAGMTATVLDLTTDGRPASVVFHFSANLDDPRYVWLRWTERGYSPWQPPRIGETASLPAFDLGRFTLDVLSHLASP